MKKAAILALVISSFGSYAGTMLDANPLTFQSNSNLKKSISPLDINRRGSSFSLSFGGQLNYNRLMGDLGISMFGLGVFGEYNNDSWAGRGAVNYCFPKKFADTYTAEANSSSNPVQSIDVDVETGVSLLMISYDQRKVFGDRDWDEGGFYGFVGASFAMAIAKTTIGSYDTQNYYIDGIDPNATSETVSQLYLRGGLGYDVDMEFAHFFGEALLSFPANNANGVAIDINLPPAVHLNVGIRFPIEL